MYSLSKGGYFNFRTMNFLEISGILFWALIGLKICHELVKMNTKGYKEVVREGIKRCVEDVN